MTPPTSCYSPDTTVVSLFTPPLSLQLKRAHAVPPFVHQAEHTHLTPTPPPSLLTSQNCAWRRRVPW